MSGYTVLATPRSFGASGPAPVELLRKNGCEVIRLTGGGEALQRALEERIPEADAVIAGLEPYGRALLERGKKLKVLSRYGVGVDGVDLAAARELGVCVTVTPGANGDSVADLAVALMLNAARHVCRMDGTVRAGGREKPPLGVEMWRKTLGVVGTGRIGRGVIQRTRGFQMPVLAYDTCPDGDFIARHGGVYTDLDDLFSRSDFITLHIPLTEETRNLADGRRLGLMKPRAVLVNTARGGVVDEQALYAALRDGRIGAAALDATLSDRPWESPLSGLENCILTPHAGAATYESNYRMGMLAAQNVLAVLRGEACPYRVAGPSDQK